MTFEEIKRELEILSPTLAKEMEKAIEKALSQRFGVKARTGIGKSDIPISDKSPTR